MGSAFPTLRGGRFFKPRAIRQFGSSAVRQIVQRAQAGTPAFLSPYPPTADLLIPYFSRNWAISVW